MRQQTRHFKQTALIEYKSGGGNGVGIENVHGAYVTHSARLAHLSICRRHELPYLYAAQTLLATHPSYSASLCFSHKKALAAKAARAQQKRPNQFGATTK
jgi:hypothetical protein